MIIVNTVAGANQFTGTAGAGLVRFDSNDGDVDPGDDINVVPLITSIFYRSDGDPHDVEVVIRDPNNPATVFGVLIEETGLNTFSKFCGPSGIVIPRFDDRFFELAFTTTGKTDDGTFTVHWNQGHAP